jgi:hypothetical protein
VWRARGGWFPLPARCGGGQGADGPQPYCGL